jgi:ribosomal protein L37E
MYIVFRCRRCGRYLYARSDVKSRKCVCGKLNQIAKVKIYGRFGEEKEAIEAVRELQGSGTDFKQMSEFL